MIKNSPHIAKKSFMKKLGFIFSKIFKKKDIQPIEYRVKVSYYRNIPFVLRETIKTVKAVSEEEAIEIVRKKFINIETIKISE